MSGSDPFQCWVLFENGFVEDDLSVFSSQSAKPSLQPIARWQQVSWDAANPVDVAVLPGRFWLNTHDRRSLYEELFNNFRHQSAFASFDGLSNDIGKVQ